MFRHSFRLSTHLKKTFFVLFPVLIILLTRTFFHHLFFLQIFTVYYFLFFLRLFTFVFLLSHFDFHLLLFVLSVQQGFHFMEKQHYFNSYQKSFLEETRFSLTLFSVFDFSLEEKNQFDCFLPLELPLQLDYFPLLKFVKLVFRIPHSFWQDLSCSGSFSVWKMSL